MGRRRAVLDEHEGALLEDFHPAHARGSLDVEPRHVGEERQAGKERIGLVCVHERHSCAYRRSDQVESSAPATTERPPRPTPLDEAKRPGGTARSSTTLA